MNARSALVWWALAGIAVTGLVLLPLAVSAADAGPGFNGYIQSGTCALPSKEFAVDFEAEGGADDIEPYVAVGEDGKSVTLGYYGAPGVPGFSVAAIYTDQRFSMVITDPDTGSAVACGDILRPEADQFGEAGLAAVSLLPVGTSEVQGVAAIERATLQRELDITPVHVRVILSTDPVSVPAEAAPGYDGYVQGGRCASPLGDVRVELKSEDNYDVSPFEAVPVGAADPITVAFYGSPRAPGFGLGAASTDQDFSVVVADPGSGDPVACGDVLEPDDDKFADAGEALVQLLPAGEAGVQGYAVLDRVAMQRELDVTPLMIRIVLFAPSATQE